MNTLLHLQRTSSTLYNNVSPTNEKIMIEKKNKIAELLKEYAAESAKSAFGADEAETVNILLTAALTAIELMGENSNDAGHLFSEAINNERHNRTAYIAEEKAKEAEFDGYEWSTFDPDNSDIVMAWECFTDALSFSIDYEATFEAAYSDSLPAAPKEEEDDATSWNGYTPGFFGC